jgi:Putative lumazine-binding
MSAVAVTNQTVAEAVQPYIDGVAAGDGAKLEQGFHESARMYRAVDGQRLDIPITEMIAMIGAKPADVDGSFRGSIRSIETSGLAAPRRARRRASRASALSLCHEVGSGRFVEASLTQRRPRRR